MLITKQHNMFGANFLELDNNFINFDNASRALLFRCFFIISVSFVYTVCIL